MPKIRTSKSKPPPAGYELLSETLDALERRMREHESAPHEGKRKAESTWGVLRVSSQRSRYVYDMHYKHKAVSREVLDYCVREGHADAALIARWRKDGYERLCCLQCVSTREHSYGTTCICRVPRRDLEAGKIFECPHCGCRGCASGDATAEALLPAAAAASLGGGGAGGGGGAWAAAAWAAAAGGGAGAGPGAGEGAGAGAGVGAGTGPGAGAGAGAGAGEARGGADPGASA